MTLFSVSDSFKDTRIAKMSRSGRFITDIGLRGKNKRFFLHGPYSKYAPLLTYSAVHDPPTQHEYL